MAKLSLLCHLRKDKEKKKDEKEQKGSKERKGGKKRGEEQIHSFIRIMTFTYL